MKHKMKEAPSSSLDVREDLVKRLLSVVPEAETDGMIDWDKLKQELTGVIDESPERYNFTWNGKKQAMRLAQQPTTATLKPNKEKSRNWDKTENLYIEGDNLEVLKLLQKSYSNKIKLIYIDPPYNTGKDFVYKDDFKDSLSNYLEQTGQIDSEGNKLSVNTDTSGRYHTDWLNMMYPRLKLARNLLTDDGVIFISIDDNEVDNLKKICGEIFGEENVETLIWNKEAEGSSGSLKQVSTTKRIHEYVICISKNFSNVQFIKVREALKGRESEFQTANLAVNSQSERTDHENYFEIVNPSGDVFLRQWKWDKTRIDELIKENLLYWGSDGHKQPRLIIPTDERRTTFLLSILNYGGTTVGRKDFEELFGREIEFSYPKPIILLKKLIETTTSREKSVVLDFFAGSSATAQAVMQLNVEDEGSRNFIMVQIPEKTAEKSEALKLGYKNICEIGEERIRRAGDKIVEENPMFAGNLDIGFKVFELDKSNIKKWNIDTTNLEEQMSMLEDNFEDGAKPLDVVYEIMIKQGLDLSYPVEEVNLEDTFVYNVGFGALFVVLGNNIKSDVASYIVDEMNKLKRENTVVVFQDQGFESDSEKLNAIEMLNTNGIKYDDIFSI